MTYFLAKLFCKLLGFTFKVEGNTFIFDAKTDRGSKHLRRVLKRVAKRIK